MDRPRLYGTTLSHFTRKPRIVLAELGVESDFVGCPGVPLGAGTPPRGSEASRRRPAAAARPRALRRERRVHR
jgi:hypothetical protein